MKRTQIRLSETSFLLRMVQLLHEMESIDKVYRMLIALATWGSAIGCRRAMLFTPDENEQVIRGRMGAVKPEVRDPDISLEASFEIMTEEVFGIFEAIDSSDITLQAKAFSVPLEWHRSALVKALRSHYPVLAEGCLSEFTTDPFFRFFDSSNYIAVPIKVNGSVIAVLAADNLADKERLSVDQISLLQSLCQQAALSIVNLVKSAEHGRRFGVLLKASQELNEADTHDKQVEGLKLGMTLACRVLEGTGCLLFDRTTQKTLHVRDVHSYSLDANGRDFSFSGCFDRILERSVGTKEMITGNGDHPLLGEEEGIERFIACPLVSARDVVGAIAIYSEKNRGKSKLKDYSFDDKNFLALTSTILASAIRQKERDGRIRRSENFLEEIRSNLNREREMSRLGQRGKVCVEKITAELKTLKHTLATSKDPRTLPKEMRRIVKIIEKHTGDYLEGVTRTDSSFRVVNLFSLMKRVISNVSGEAEKRGIKVDVRIPEHGPELLMDERSITLALMNIVSSISSSLKRDDTMLVECKDSDDRALILIADTGSGLPGEILSKLFIPFSDVEMGDERKNALSLAADILHSHGGEIVMKTSMTWKTIFILSFSKAANRDRRKARLDRRNSWVKDKAPTQ